MDAPLRSLMENPRRHRFKMEEQNVPQLRFPEFDEAWGIHRVEELLIGSRLGGNYSNNNIKNDNPLIKMGNLNRGKIIVEKLDYIDKEEELNEEDKIKSGDLFFNTRNTLDLVGKVAIWRDELERAYYNSNLLRIDFKNNSFMNYRFNTYKTIKNLRRLATGTTSVAAIYNRDLFKLKLTIPRQPKEQQKIASFLSAVDKKIEQLTRKKELLEKYKKGVMQKLFPKSGEQHPELRFKDENGEDFPDWEVKPLKEILKINYGKDYKHLGDGKIPLLGTGGVMRYVDDYLYDKPSVLIGRKGSIDTPQFIDQPFWTVDTLFYTEVLNDIDPFFAYLLITTVNLLKYNEASGVPSLSASTLYSIKMSVPKSGKEQKKISKTVKSINTRIELIESKIQQTQSFKKGLLQQMFV